MSAPTDPCFGMCPTCGPDPAWCSCAERSAPRRPPVPSGYLWAALAALGPWPERHPGHPPVPADE